MNEQRILVVDDDPGILEVLQTRLESHGYAVDTAIGGRQALEQLDDHHVDLLITDLRMPGMDGLELVRRMQTLDARPPTLFLTAHGSIPDAVQAMRLGACDFLMKPYSGQDLMTVIRRALAQRLPFTAPGASDEGDEIAGDSLAIRRVLSLIERVASTRSSVLITGQSGTGKELVAGRLHRQSRAAGGPYVVIDCGALSDTLLESELFGHRRGAFTSATEDKKGLLEMANGGTVLLDEIGDISRSLQTRLLRFLQHGEIRRVGDVAPRRVDVRILAATNRDLEAATADGSFRQDLFYRLKVVTIHLPALRERSEDIPALAAIFLASSARTLERSLHDIVPAALRLLCDHSWPGNVRELKHVIEAAAALSSGEVLGVPDLREAGFPWGGGAAPQEEAVDDLTALARCEKEQILGALQDSNWVQKRAADALGISGRVIHYKIRKYGIQIPSRS